MIIKVQIRLHMIAFKSTLIIF